MSTLDAVRNKLILRVFACVNQNLTYEKNYSKLVAKIIEIGQRQITDSGNIFILQWETKNYFVN